MAVYKTGMMRQKVSSGTIILTVFRLCYIKNPRSKMTAKILCNLYK